MSFEDDILLARTQTSIWAPNYVEEREMRSTSSAAAANSMRSATSNCGQMTIVRMYYLCRSEEHTSELQSLMRISYAVFCWKKKKTHMSSPVAYRLSLT